MNTLATMPILDVIATKTRRRKTEMRDGQIRILEALAQHDSLTRQQCADFALKGHMGWAFNHIGPTEEGEQREKTEKRTGYPGLLTLKYVRANEIDVLGDGKIETRYEITPEGRKALKEYQERHPTTETVNIESE